MSSVLGMAILTSFGGRESEKYIGWVYTANGIGLLASPVAGAVLYQIGGFAMPFYVVGR